MTGHIMPVCTIPLSSSCREGLSPETLSPGSDRSEKSIYFSLRSSLGLERMVNDCFSILALMPVLILPLICSSPRKKGSGATLTFITGNWAGNGMREKRLRRFPIPGNWVNENVPLMEPSKLRLAPTSTISLSSQWSKKSPQSNLYDRRALIPNPTCSL